MSLFKPKPNALQAAHDLALEINENARAYWLKYAEVLGTPDPIYFDGHLYRRKINHYSWKGVDALLGEAYRKIQAEMQEQAQKAEKVTPKAVTPKATPPNMAPPTRSGTQQSPEPASAFIPTATVSSEEPNEWEDPSITKLAQKIKSLIETNLGMLEHFLLHTEKADAIRQSFVKHQIFAYLFVISIEFQKRHPALLIGYRNQLIREIRSSLPLLSYSSAQLIQGFQAFEGNLSELSQQREMKFFFDSTCQDRNSVPSVPGYLSYLVCEEAQINEDPKCSHILLGLFNMLIECAQKEHLFDTLMDKWTARIRRMN